MIAIDATWVITATLGFSALCSAAVIRLNRKAQRLWEQAARDWRRAEDAWRRVAAVSERRVGDDAA